MKATTMCEFTRQEFIGGLQSIGLVLLAIAIFQYEVDPYPQSTIHMVLLVSLLVICRVDSIEKFRAKLPSLRAELKDDSEFPFLKAKLGNVLHRSLMWPLSSESYSAMHRKSASRQRVSFSLELMCGMK